MVPYTFFTLSWAVNLSLPESPDSYKITDLTLRFVFLCAEHLKLFVS